MKFIRYASLLTTNLLIFSFFSFSQPKTEKDLSKIKELLNQQVDSWNEGDLEGYMQGYWKSDSLLFIGGSGPTYGWKATLENYNKSYSSKEKMGVLAFDLLSINVENTSAVIFGKWQLQRENDMPKGYFSLYLKKIDGEWKIVIDHSSSSEK